MKKNQQIIIISIIAIILISITIAMYYIANSRNQGDILISKVPDDLTLLIDGEEVEDKYIDLDNGTYQLTAKRNGFYDYAEELTVNDSTTFIAVGLLATEESEEARQWVKENGKQYLDQEELVGKMSGEEGAKFLENNPIIEILPIGIYNYRIGYILDQEDQSGEEIIVTIDADSGYRNAGVNAIFEAGYNPADYKIMFYNYTNPFEVENDK